MSLEILFKRRSSLASICIGVLLGSASSVGAATFLGSAQDFAVLGASTVTNAGVTTIDGNVGVWPGTAITGMSSATVNGTIDAGDTAAMAAHNDAQLAFTSLADLAPTADLGGSLGGLTLSPGVYAISSAAQLTGTLTLDFATDPGGTFVFQIGTALTTAMDSNVVVVDGGPTSGIYWEIGSSATLGGDTDFAGNIIANQSITMDTGSSIVGRVIALVAAVTMNANLAADSCTSCSNQSDFGSRGFSGAVIETPEPATWVMMLTGFGLLGAASRSRREALRA